MDFATISQAGSIAFGVPEAATVKPASKSTDPARLLNAAREFESFLIAQMLKSSREAGSEGWMGTGDDPSGASAVETAEQQLAQALSASGGFGLAQMASKGLDQTGKK